MIEFYTTMRVTGRCPGVRCNEGWFRAGHIRGAASCSLSRPACRSLVSGPRYGRSKGDETLALVGHGSERLAAPGYVPERHDLEILGWALANCDVA